MESEIETTGFNKKGWIGKIKDWSYENWQTILVILIVLIVGISAYNYNRQNDPSTEDQSSVAIIDNDESENIDENKMDEENNINQEKNNEEVSEADIENEDQMKAAEEDGEIKKEDKDKNKDNEENNSVISGLNDSGKIYTVYANRGEGITHLARRAMNEYLQETGVEYELTKEHKVYVEDYLQNKTGAESIEVDHQETFSENLIEEAISSAKQLTPNSLDNLKKYIK
jgi:hypothetical protein